MHRFCILLILCLVVIATCTVHKKGIPEMGIFTYREENLFTRNLSYPQDYTLVYSYLCTKVGGSFDYVELHVNGSQESTASIDIHSNFDLADVQSVKVRAQIQNTTDFASNIKISGVPGIDIDVSEGLDQLLNIKRMEPRSYSLLCASANFRVRPIKWKNVLFEFGHRSDTDVILHLQTEFIDPNRSVNKSTPQFTFSFEDPQINISYVVLAADSPWAIVFRNKINVTDHGIRATVYGLDRKPFAIQLAVFGTHNKLMN